MAVVAIAAAVAWVAPQVAYGARVPLSDILRPIPVVEWNRGWWNSMMSAACSANQYPGSPSGYYWDEAAENCKHAEAERY